jgi:hypothetical protein
MDGILLRNSAACLPQLVDFGTKDCLTAHSVMVDGFGWCAEEGMSGPKLIHSALSCTIREVPIVLVCAPLPLSRQPDQN